jgi:hypothetical protein
MSFSFCMKIVEKNEKNPKKNSSTYFIAISVCQNINMIGFVWIWNSGHMHSGSNLLEKPFKKYIDFRYEFDVSFDSNLK